MSDTDSPATSHDAMAPDRVHGRSPGEALTEEARLEQARTGFGLDPRDAMSEVRPTETEDHVAPESPAGRDPFDADIEADIDDAGEGRPSQGDVSDARQDAPAAPGDIDG